MWLLPTPFILLMNKMDSLRSKNDRVARSIISRLSRLGWKSKSSVDELIIARRGRLGLTDDVLMLLAQEFESDIFTVRCKVFGLSFCIILIVLHRDCGWFLKLTSHCSVALSCFSGSSPRGMHQRLYTPGLA